MTTFFGLIGFGLILTIALSMMLPLMASQPPKLSIPVDCAMGTDCFIQNYVDVDASEQWADYRCGALSYDGHKGTDFRTKTLVEMQRGVAVLAAAKGTVARLRDGMPDVSIKDARAIDVSGSECGNGIVIKHNGGFETQYCHLKKGSLLVSEGETVRRGQPIAEIGLSGSTEFPHLHFALRDDTGAVVDPFSGKISKVSCQPDGFASDYWIKRDQDKLRYVDAALLGIGFTDEKPDSRGVQEGKFRDDTLPDNADALIFWAELMGLQDGDRLVMELYGPDRVAVVNFSKTIEGNKARWFQFAGKRRTTDAWPAGTYTGNLRIYREKNGKIQVVLNELRGLNITKTDTLSPGTPESLIP